MQLSKDIPVKIDVLEYLLPILKRMTIEPLYEGDTRTPELRFIEVLEELSINTTEAERLIQFVEAEIMKVAKERKLMGERAEGYVELYATNYNHYFRETKNYKSQVGRIQSMMRHIIEEFTNTSKREKYIYYEYNENENDNEKWKRKMHSLFDSSPLNRPQVQNSLFGLETFQPIHQLLFFKLQKLFLNLQELFEFAQNVDNMVEGLRKKDHARILAIFKKCKEKKKNGDMKYLMLALNYTTLGTIFPDLTKDLQEMTFEDFVVKYYHELNDAEFALVIPLYEKHLKDCYGVEKDEASLYEDVLDVQKK